MPAPARELEVTNEQILMARESGLSVIDIARDLGVTPASVYARCLTALNRRPVSGAFVQRLSTRALNALRAMAGDNDLTDGEALRTAGRFVGMKTRQMPKDCGIGTVAEILEWRASILGRED
jgi:hypothetical protein